MKHSPPSFVGSVSGSALLIPFFLLIAFCLPVQADDAVVAPPTAPPFLLQNSPRPVLFFGDDATAQRMFTTLIETYTLSRFPAWNITFRNTGWEGDKILGVGLRGYSRDEDMRRDIESFRPQMAIVNYGINDARGGDASYEFFLTNVNILSRDLPRIGVYHAAFVSSNPEEGYEAGAPAGSSDNLMLQKYAEGMKERLPAGWKDGVESVQRHPKGPDVPQLPDGIFIDVLNPMIGLIEAGRKAGVLSSDPSLGDKTVRLMPDGIHPDWAGHFISSADLDATARSTISAQGCAITWQDASPGVVQFERKDEALPWPTPPDVDMARKIPGFDPATDLNRYELKVSGLKEASYQLFIDDQAVGVYSGTDLASGVNLGFLRQGPIYDQGQKLLKAVLDKNDTFFHRWRNVELGPPPAAGTSVPDIRKAEAAHLNDVKPELARLDKIIADDEQAIHALCQPTAHVFKLVPVAR
jgi:hypothetical protein